MKELCVNKNCVCKLLLLLLNCVYCRIGNTSIESRNKRITIRKSSKDNWYFFCFQFELPYVRFRRSIKTKMNRTEWFGWCREALPVYRTTVHYDRSAKRGSASEALEVHTLLDDMNSKCQEDAYQGRSLMLLTHYLPTRFCKTIFTWVPRTTIV